jgi:hypothetical protein
MVKMPPPKKDAPLLETLESLMITVPYERIPPPLGLEGEYAVFPVMMLLLIVRLPELKMPPPPLAVVLLFEIMVLLTVNIPPL